MRQLIHNLRRIGVALTSIAINLYKHNRNLAALRRLEANRK